MSDISSSVTPQPGVSSEMQTSLKALNHQARELKAEVKQLRRLQLSNAETMRETIHHTYHKIRVHKTYL